MHDNCTLESNNCQSNFLPRSEKKWDSHRAVTQEVEHALAAYGDINQWKQADRVAQCSEWLEYRVPPNPEERVRLQKAAFCHVRGCPVCEWRRTLRKTAQMYQNLPGIMEKLPQGTRFLFLTLTIANCRVEDLRENVELLYSAFKAIKRRKFWKENVFGCVRVLEITHSRAIEDSHPHLHVLLAVRASYFHKHYMSQRRWTSEWKSALGVEYTPIMDIRTLKDAGTIPELCKYCVKEQDMLEDIKWFVQCMAQLRGVHMYTQYGALRGLFSDQRSETDEDLVHAGEEGEEKEDTSEKGDIVRYDWNRRIRRYQKYGILNHTRNQN